VGISEVLLQILDLQKDFSSSQTPSMVQRRELVEKVLKNSIVELLRKLPQSSNYKVDASHGIGNSAVVPWVRIFDPKQSPSAQEGWYLVFLFAKDGSSVFLSLNMGVTKLSSAEIESKATLTRKVLEGGPQLANIGPFKLSAVIDLAAPNNGLALKYQKGNIEAIEFKNGQNYDDQTWARAVEYLLEELERLPKNNQTEDVALQSDELSEFTSRTGWTASQAARVLASVSDKSPQIVLQGPPGTGKTFVAYELAKYLMAPLDDGDLQDRVEIVQFHPSYAYEDFVEGLRPEPSDSGGLHFAKTPGVLLRIAAKIRADGKSRVLIIDEMNRANLPKVFGELMYLLEYREQSISLMYHGQFALPANLYIIGTMNTADRSIKSLDIALRRRFDFFDVLPSSEILEKHFESRENELGSMLFEGFRNLNTRIEQDMGDRNYAIGHSYLMLESMSLSSLKDVWDLQLKPLVEDYFFDRPELAEEYSLENFWF
jgi:hypothetical protein